MQLLSRFKEKWNEGSFAMPAHAVLLAVSGGSDSMAMAHLFLSAGIPFAVAHCNFGLRGIESDLDEQLVKDWCSANYITCHNILFDTKKTAAEWKKSTQETARDLRYYWFEELRSQHDYARIVTAHHANDNVETMLINLFKGTGISGLHGIPPINGHIVRPLLFAIKEDINAYVAEHNIPFRNDASNESDDYLRNAIRHNIVPVAEQLLPGMVSRVNESITRFAEAEELYNKAINLERKKLIQPRGNDFYIPINKLKHRQPLNTICYELFHPCGFSSAQVPHILSLLASESGHYIASRTHRIIRNRDFLVITTLPQATADLITIDAAPAVIDTGNYIFTFTIKDRPDNIPTDKNEAWLDMKNITFPLLLRKWRNGDYLYPLGMNMKKKKVSRLFIDEKVSLPQKEEMRILETNKKIIWVSGLRLDERFKITPTTSQVLFIKRTPKN